MTPKQAARAAKFNLELLNRGVLSGGFVALSTPMTTRDVDTIADAADGAIRQLAVT
ncbi:hypothetical protein J2R96_002003 [Bradyrhizobium elkanii]|nr:hypothetical protein [Bradyrhizobium elkanii]